MNGLVRIGHSRDGGNVFHHWGSAHVHDYGTSVIGNELRSILEDPVGTHNVELTFNPAFGQIPAQLSLFDDESVLSGILFRYTEGPKMGRAFGFTPVDGDSDGWNEMVAYARLLIDNDALKQICRYQDLAMA